MFHLSQVPVLHELFQPAGDVHDLCEGVPLAPAQQHDGGVRLLQGYRHAALQLRHRSCRLPQAGVQAAQLR